MESLTPVQREKLDAFLESLEGRAEKVKIRIKAKREKTRIKIKTKLGKTDAEVDSIEERIEGRANLEKIREKAVAKAIVRIERKIANLRNLAEKANGQGKDVSKLEERLDEAESLLNKVKSSEDKSIREVREAIHEINRLLNFRRVFIALKDKDVEGKLAKLENRRELIKAKVEKRLEEAERIQEMRHRGMMQNKKMMMRRNEDGDLEVEEATEIEETSEEESDSGLEQAEQSHNQGN